jgi:ribosomal-protein-alanine N-acetyltransferase
MERSHDLHYPWVVTMDREAFLAYLDRASRPDIEALLVCRAQDGALAGFVNLSQIFYGGFCNAMCGYAAFAPAAGRGFMSEGLRLTIRHAFTTLRLHRLEANIQPGNERSRALAGSCGFRLEGFSPRYLQIHGEWRDHERWAITTEDWRGEGPRPPA